MFKFRSLGAVDISYALRPATCSRGPFRSMLTRKACLLSKISGSREQVAGRRAS